MALWVPGVKKNNYFLTVGAGIGSMQGEFTQSVTGSKRAGQVTTNLDNTMIYKGTTTAYHGTIGVTFVPWHYLELDLRLNGRYALIKTLRDESGNPFTNAYGDNEAVSLNLSGVDLRFGCTFVFP